MREETDRKNIPVAIKVVKLDPDIQTKEREIHGSCRHKNIVELFEVVEVGNDTLYFIMELMQQDVWAFLNDLTDKKKLLKQKEAQHMTKDMLQGLVYLHNSHIIHLDLKSNNLLLDNKENLKICDLGMARYEQDGMKLGCMQPPDVGNKGYMSPEILQNKQYSKAADMFAVGCLLMEFLTTYQFFRTCATASQQLKIMSMRLEKFNGDFNKISLQDFKTMVKRNFHHITQVDDSAYELIIQCLMFKPDKRISSRDAVNHKWLQT